MKFIETVKKMLPGCAIALVIAVVAKFLEQLEESAGLHLIGASVIAMFIGMIVNRFYAPNEKTRPGIKFTSKKILKFAIILLGASLNITTVLKRDGRREEFSPEKLREGIRMACWKRNISNEVLDGVVGDITIRLTLLPQDEVQSSVIGELVMEALKKVDEVAYVRYASVYRKFQDTKPPISARGRESRSV